MTWEMCRELGDCTHETWEMSRELGDCIHERRFGFIMPMAS